jgi:hypothetical protein
MNVRETCLVASALLLAGSVAAQNPPPAPVDFDFSISYSGSSITGRLVGLHLDANGNGTDVDPSSVLLFHVPAITGLSASPGAPYVFVPHTFERSTYFSGTLSSTTPGVLGFQVFGYKLVPAAQNLLMIDAGADVTLVFNFGASLSAEGGVATYGIQAEEDALWPAIDSFVSYAVVQPPVWANLGSGLAGSSGIPALAGSGTLVAGTPGSLALTGGHSRAAALLFVSFSSAPIAFKGGLLVAFPFSETASLGTDGSGSVGVPFTWPAGVPPLTALFFQAAVEDASAPHGASLSNAIRALTP